MTKEQEVSRGARAKQLTDDPLFKEAITTIRENLTRKWTESDPKDKDGREEVYRYLKVLSEVERFFLTVIQSGQIAQEELSRVQKLKARFGRK